MFRKEYHNNEFNYLLSTLTDKKRSIMDIDCVLSKFGYDTFLIDHKKGRDKTSLSTLRTLSNYAGITLNSGVKIRCFIVRSEVDTDLGVTKGTTKVFEIYPLPEVRNKKEASSFLKETYLMTSDADLKLFFQQETHFQVADRLIYKAE